MLVGSAFMDDSNHGSVACDACHSGNPTGTTRADAHVGLVPDPTRAGAATGCACHAATVATAAKSLHTTLEGIRHSIVERSGSTSLCPELQSSFTNHCSRCHSSCGNCHVSVPASAGGGLLNKHKFTKTPPMNTVCTACHGSRVGDEYRGLNPGIPADVHYNKGLQCTRCHTNAEMHGSGADGAKHRYQVKEAPKCTTCHPDNEAFRSNSNHGMHRTAQGALKLACQVCHSITYKNCSSCHVRLDNGKPVYEVNAPSHESLMTFKIGLNPAPDALHPEKWVLLRHVPIDPDNYKHYGDGLLQSFDANPTWRPTTPHNIQRRTPQAGGCMTTCHGKRELFLGPSDLAAYEVQANAGVVVPDDRLP